MALSRAAKEALIEQYQEGLSGNPHAFLVGFKGIKVSEVDELRRKVGEQGGSYSVVKNRLALLAIQGTAYEGLGEHFEGPTALALSVDDPVGLAKTLTEFAKDVPVLEFKAGLVDGQQVGGEEIKAIAALPTREELIAKLLFLLQSPITRLVRGLAAIPREFVVVLDQISKKREA